MRVPKAFHDDLPPEPPQLEGSSSPEPTRLEKQTPPVEEATSSVQTAPNAFGVYRAYETSLPSFVPSELNLDNSTASPSNLLKSQIGRSTDVPVVVPSPFATRSTELLMGWFYNSSNVKSFATLNSLVSDVILDPNFKPSDFTGFSAAKQAKALDDFKVSHPRLVLCPEDGWIETSVPIHLPPPKRGNAWPAEENTPIYNVNGLFYRKPLEVIKAALQEKAAERFHLTPFKEYWIPSTGEPPE